MRCESTEAFAAWAARTAACACVPWVVMKCWAEICHGQKVHFRKEDERVLRELLKKMKLQADAVRPKRHDQW